MFSHYFFNFSIVLIIAMKIPICTSSSIHYPAGSPGFLIENEIERSDFHLRCLQSASGGLDVRCSMFIFYEKPTLKNIQASIGIFIVISVYAGVSLHLLLKRV